MTAIQGNTVRQTTFEQDWEQWRAEREFELTAPHGWLSLTAFHWLPTGPVAFDGLPGGWSADEQSATHRSVGGEPETASVAEAGSLNWIRWDDRLVELLRRGGRYAIRVRDPKAQARTGFQGVPSYPVDATWVIAGTYQPFEVPRQVVVATARADLQQQVSIVGTVTFQLEDAQLRLLAGAGRDGALNIIFHDETNGVGSAAWRSVSTSIPDRNGAVTIDFNRAVNMPFAFSDYGTCPAPPAGNRIPAPVTAGERAPR